MKSFKFLKIVFNAYESNRNVLSYWMYFSLNEKPNMIDNYCIFIEIGSEGVSYQ